MSELQPQSPSEPSPFKIAIKPRTPEELAEQDRKMRLIEDEYSRSADKIIERIPEHIPEAEMLAVLYSIFLDEMTYDHEWGKNVTNDGLVSRPVDSTGKYELLVGEDSVDLGGRMKEYAVIKGTGVCGHFSDAFSDIAGRLGIPCATVSGKTKMVEAPDGSVVGLGHAWNQVAIDGEIKNIDITYGLYASDDAVKQEKEMAPELTAADFFMVDSDQLRRTGPHHDFEDSVELLPEATV